MQDDFFESTPWRGAADKRDVLFQDEDLELPLIGFLDAQTLKKGGAAWWGRGAACCGPSVADADAPAALT